jgi:IS1 family transposase
MLQSRRTSPTSTSAGPGHGDVWMWVAIDADTKLVPSWLVRERTTEDCYTFLRDLRSQMPPFTGHAGRRGAGPGRH